MAGLFTASDVASVGRALLDQVLPLSVIAFVYQRGMVPIYASSPTSYHLNGVILTTALISALQPLRLSQARRRLWTAVALTFLPKAAYWTAVWTSRQGNPIKGPAVTHISVLAPIVALHFAPVTTHATAKAESFPITRRALRAAISAATVTKLAAGLWGKITFLNGVSDSQIYLALACINYCAWLLDSPAVSVKSKKKPTQTPSWKWNKYVFVGPFIGLWTLASPWLSSPVLPHPLPSPYDHPTFPLRIYSSVQSVTGLIVVGEALPPPNYNGEEDDEKMHSVRYLRASHSILGGVWTGQKVMTIDDVPPLFDKDDTPLGDSIYSTFVLQEAALLLDSELRHEGGPDAPAREALFIGLGTGISTTAFMRHGVSTTIVEIDPAVYQAARRYFALPDPGPNHVFLEDARAWVARQRANAEARNSTTFDFVVHDCFSGGGIPQHIYTVQFWQDVKKILRPEGVIVVNFAGQVQSDASRMVYYTLMSQFSQCRGFHDLIGDLLPEDYETKFINVVLFCTDSEKPLNFRSPKSSDFLGSPLRRHVLMSLSRREIDLQRLRLPPGEDASKYVLTDTYNPLGKLQEEQGPHHWKLMREILPDIFWEVF